MEHENNNTFTLTGYQVKFDSREIMHALAQGQLFIVIIRSIWKCRILYKYAAENQFIFFVQCCSQVDMNGKETGFSIIDWSLKNNNQIGWLQKTSLSVTVQTELTLLKYRETISIYL